MGRAPLLAWVGVARERGFSALVRWGERARETEGGEGEREGAHELDGLVKLGGRVSGHGASIREGSVSELQERERGSMGASVGQLATCCASASSSASRSAHSSPLRSHWPPITSPHTLAPSSDQSPPIEPTRLAHSESSRLPFGVPPFPPSSPRPTWRRPSVSPRLCVLGLATRVHCTTQHPPPATTTSTTWPLGHPTPVSRAEPWRGPGGARALPSPWVPLLCLHCTLHPLKDTRPPS